MVPDVAPDDGMHPSLQVPPHLRVVTATEYFPASQFVQTVDAMAAEYLPATQSSHAVLAGKFHVPVKPLRITVSSDVKVTLRKPVVDV